MQRAIAANRGPVRGFVACVLLVAALSLSAQASAGNIVNFSAPTSFTLPINPSAMATGDFNGDGDPDLAVANDASGNVSILVGGAGGTFSGPVNFAAGGGANGIAVGNFNADSDPDLAVSNSGDTVSILLGSTGATFGTPVAIAAGDFPTDVTVGEFNGDSDPDLAVTNQDSDNVSILLATGDGSATFFSATNFAAGDRPSAVAARDFNGDGDPDLAVTNYGPLSDPKSDTVSIFTGDPQSGRFLGPTNIEVGDFPTDVAIGDFNGDLDQDLAVTNQGSSTVSILTGGLGASFAPAATLAGGARSVSIGDFNRDSDLDLAVGGNAGNNLSIFVGGAGATFAAPQVFPAGGVVESVGVADFNADTRPDVAAANYFDAKASTVLNTSDLTPPNTTISPTPPAFTNDNTPQFSFSSSEPAGATFECRVYQGSPSGAFSACTSPHTTAPLANGAWTFEVRARDAAGNVDPSPASHGFTVDTVAPDTTISSGPSGTTNDNTPRFEFSSEAGTTFECRVYQGSPSGAFGACSSPHTSTALADGSWTFEVRARDAAGNVDLTPAQRSFTVDATPPETTVDSGPSGETADSTPTFGFRSSEPAGATFECRVYQGPPSGDFGSCTSPHTTAPLADGTWTFEVRATDADGNGDPTPASRSFTVRTAVELPDTSITSAPTVITPDRTPTFSFNSNVAGATFECSIDGGPFVPCSSPYTPASALGPGSHSFRVRARSAGGDVDPTPAATGFVIPAALADLPPPTVGKTFNVEPVGGGEVFVSEGPGAARATASARARQSITVPGIKGRNFVPLREARQVSVGSLIDTRKGRVRLLSARDGGGRTQSGEFLSGVFQVLQSRRRSAKGLTELRLKGSSFKRCRTTRRGKKASAARSKRRIRRLRGNARGRFRTRGRYSAATVRGTIWETTDRCDGTLTKVTRGKVAVRDFRRRKNILLRAGKSYLARAPR